MFSESLTYQATVTPTAAGAPTPTGTVSLLDGGSTIATLSLPAGGNQVSFVLPNLSVGTHALAAKYSGDGNIAAQVSAAVQQNVMADPTNTALGSSLNPSFYGGSVTFTATVSKTGNATATPTGS